MRPTIPDDFVTILEERDRLRAEVEGLRELLRLIDDREAEALREEPERLRAQAPPAAAAIVVVWDADVKDVHAFEDVDDAEDFADSGPGESRMIAHTDIWTWHPGRPRAPAIEDGGDPSTR